ncbi:sodium-dependent multivitamin transporter [Trichonephila clavipes]|nr:sodium-dependent multivitamin transporter [Trichonephila clavipes]
MTLNLHDSVESDLRVSLVNNGWCIPTRPPFSSLFPQPRTSTSATRVHSLNHSPSLTPWWLYCQRPLKNVNGAVIGLLSAISIAAWISFGASANAPDPKFLPVSLEGCPANSSLTSSILNETTTLPLISRNEISMLNESMISDTDAIAEEIFPVYKLSYMWFAPIGLIVGLVVGYVASTIINLISGETPDVPDELLSPLVKYFMNKKTDSKEKEIKAVGSIELKNMSKKVTNGVTVKTSKEKERF